MSDELVPVWSGGITTAGKLRLDDPEGLRAYCSSLSGQPVEVVIRRKSDGRSLQANAYYHGIVVKLLAEHCGYNPSEMHAALKLKCNQGQSTAALSRKAFSDYVESCKRFAAEELGVVIPEPGHVEL